MKRSKTALLATFGAAAMFAALGPAPLASAGTVAHPAKASVAHSAKAAFAANQSIVIQNVFNQGCMDGREGTGNVTLLGCGFVVDGNHEVWQAIDGSSNGSRLQNLFNHECLDGRLGTGNVTLQTCGVDGTHEFWTLRTVGDAQMTEIKNTFNKECLDGRLGHGNVTLQPCGFPGPIPDGTHEVWEFLV